MDEAAWRMFVAAVELGSLSKVALSFETSQPQVTRVINALERRCGGRLFQRTGRGVFLTDFGARILPDVQAWLANTEQLADSIRTFAGTPAGRVCVGSLPSTTHPFISALHRRLKDRYPLIQLSVREGQGAQLETWLEDGSVDLAVLYRASASPRSGDVNLVKTASYLVSTAADPTTENPTVPFSALRNLPLVLFCRPNSWRSQLETLSAEAGFSLRVVLEADSLSLQMSVVSEGGIYAILGPFVLAEARSSWPLRAAKIVDPAVYRYVALATSPRKLPTLACRTVMSEMQEIAKSDEAGLRRGALVSRITGPGDAA